MASKLEVEIEAQSNAEKLWQSIMNSSTVFPKAMPHQYESIQIVEGDGKSKGTVHLITYQPGYSEVSTTKEKFEMVDEANKTLIYSVIEGGVLKYYKTFKANLTITPKGDHGSLIKWICEFDKANDDQITNTDLMKDFVIKNFQALDAYVFGVACL